MGPTLVLRELVFMVYIHMTDKTAKKFDRKITFFTFLNKKVQLNYYLQAKEWKCQPRDKGLRGGLPR